MNYFDFNDPFVQKILISVGVVLLTYLIAIWIIRLINKKIEDYKHRHQARRYTYYLSTLLTIIIIIIIWADQSEAITTYIGFLSAGLALALHQVLLNIAGWLLLILRRPFDLGDRIEWDEIRGDVIDIRVFYTTLLEVGNWVEGDQSTGRMVTIPNSSIFSDPLFNYTKGFGSIWNELRFKVTYESDWEKAREIILDIGYQRSKEEVQSAAKKKIDKMSKSYMIKYGKLTPITYIDIKESGVQITLRYLTSVRQRRMIENNIYEEVLKAFSDETNIEFAYPTSRVYRRNEEICMVDNFEG
ncbi:mechanosensitive ion channel family protein [Halonatronum saccharophilum]|uniref:mechanosensitive ion channel family protein n=1 Tax=Halonatronum saccharophilum TaxID=150060 RepID=UPI000487EB58|nr:mechanosensitive ion channel family protein [Halonatronum saccharophilum]